MNALYIHKEVIQIIYNKDQLTFVDEYGKLQQDEKTKIPSI